jgi:N-acetylmuramoyl-L-alanine amidase
MHPLWAGVRLAFLPYQPLSRLNLTKALILGAAASSALAWSQPGLSVTPQVGPIAQAPETAAPGPAVPSDRIARPTLRLGSQGEPVNELQAMLKLLGFFPGSVTGQFQESTQEAVKQFQTAAGLTPDGIVGSATWSQLLPTPPGEANPPTAATTPPAATPAVAPAAPTAPATTPPATSAGSNGSGSNGSGRNGAAPAAASPSPAQPSRPTSGATDRPVLRPGMEGPAVTRLQERLRALGFYRGTIDGIFGTQTETAVKQAQRHYNLEPDGIVGPATWGVLLP